MDRVVWMVGGLLPSCSKNNHLSEICIYVSARSERTPDVPDKRIPYECRRTEWVFFGFVHDLRFHGLLLLTWCPMFSLEAKNLTFWVWQSVHTKAILLAFGCFSSMPVNNPELWQFWLSCVVPMSLTPFQESDVLSHGWDSNLGLVQNKEENGSASLLLKLANPNDQIHTRDQMLEHTGAKELMAVCFLDLPG